MPRTRLGAKKSGATRTAGPDAGTPPTAANDTPSGVSPPPERLCGKRGSNHVRRAPRQMPAPSGLPPTLDEAPRPPTLEDALRAARQQYEAARAAFKGNRPYPAHGTDAQKAEWRAVLRRCVQAHDDLRRLMVLVARDCMSEPDKQNVDRLARALVVLNLMVQAAKGHELNEDAKAWLQAAEANADKLLREFGVVADVDIETYERYKFNLKTRRGHDYVGRCVDGIEATVRGTQPQNEWAKDVARAELLHAISDFREALRGAE